MTQPDIVDRLRYNRRHSTMIDHVLKLEAAEIIEELRRTVEELRASAQMGDALVIRSLRARIAELEAKQ